MTKPNVATAKIRDAIHPLTLLLSRTRVKYTVRWSKTAKPLPDKPMIFAVNHTNSCDGPVSARAISQAFHRRSWFLAGKQRLWVSDRIWLFLNGTIWVDRQDKVRLLEKWTGNYMVPGRNLEPDGQPFDATYEMGYY